MRQFVRGNTPQILEENWEQWGNEFAAQRNANPSYRFNWRTINGITLNHHILPHLSSQTENHCSYCDKYPLDRGDNTIDHFKPKHDPLFYNLVCNWHNLYLACDSCQEAKMKKYSDELLRPDANDYSFDLYFDYNYTTHEILPKPNQSDINKNKALTTIEIFDFNFIGLRKARKFAFEKFELDPNPILSDYNFRFLFE